MRLDSKRRLLQQWGIPEEQADNLEALVFHPGMLVWEKVLNQFLCDYVNQLKGGVEMRDIYRSQGSIRSLEDILDTIKQLKKAFNTEV